MNGPKPGTEYQPKNEYQTVRELIGHRFPFAGDDDGNLTDQTILESLDGLRGYMLAVIVARGIPEGRHEPVSGRRFYLAPRSVAEYVDLMRAFGSPHEQHDRGQIRIGNVDFFDAMIEWGIPRDTREKPRPSLYPAERSFRDRCLTKADLRAFNETVAMDNRGAGVSAPPWLRLPDLLPPHLLSGTTESIQKVAKSEEGFCYVYVECEIDEDSHVASPPTPHHGGLMKIGFSKDEETLLQNMDDQQRSNPRFQLFCLFNGGRAMEQWWLRKAFRIHSRKNDDSPRLTETCRIKSHLVNLIRIVHSTAGVELPGVKTLIGDERFTMALTTIDQTPNP